MTLQKKIRNKMSYMSLGELRQALMQCEELRYDYVQLYKTEYQRCEKLQERINVLKKAQRAAQMPFMGDIDI